MSHPNTVKLIESLVEQIKAAGVRDYIIALADPDDNEDLARFGGSMWWRIGAGRMISQQCEADALLGHEKEFQ